MQQTKVMIVEDDIVIANDLQARIEGLGYRVTANITSGGAALTSVKEANPDLILMDISLAGDMDGIDTAESLLPKSQAPVIFISDFDDQEKLKRAHLAQPFGYLLKPVDDRDLRLTMEMALYADKVDRARREAVKGLLESEDRFRGMSRELALIFDTVPAAIWYKDTHNRFMKVNKAGAESVGMRIDEIEGKTAYNLFPEEAANYFKDDMEVMTSGKPKLGVVGRLQTASGEKLWVRTDRVPVFSDDGDITGVILFIIDISEQKRAEEDRFNFEKQIQHAQKRESLGALAGSIGHDFNNLLVSVLGNADLALQKLSPTASVRQEISDIRETAGKAAELASQMLAYSGRGAFVLEAVDLSCLVDDMTHLLEVSTTKKAALRFDLAPELPSVNINVTQIRQVIVNLITNATEAITGRSGAISISTGIIQSGEPCQNQNLTSDDLPIGDYVFLRVSDTGCGMDPEIQAKLFDPFFSTKFTGRGLGMAATLGIVRGHDGAIGIDSESGKGTTVTVLLPASKLPVVAGLPPETTVGQWSGRGTVLLVDDEKSVRDVTGRMIESSGLRLLTATDGREAVNVFLKHTDEIDVVLLDITMPHMNGLEAFDKIRQISPNAKIILSSGYNEHEAASQLTGGDQLTGFLQKPYGLAALQNMLRDALGD